MYFKAPLLDVDAQRTTRSPAFKVSIALIGGSCLVLLAVMATSAFNNTSVAETTSLLGMPTSLRLGMNPSSAVPITARNLPGAGMWQNIALAGIEASGQCTRDVSTNANSLSKAVLGSISSADKAMVAKAEAMVSGKDILKAGATAPLGFWDPLGLSTEIEEGTLLFYREAEIKHGRVCMLATLGIFVAESGFHPLFGGNIDAAAAKVFTQYPLSIFWPVAALQFLTASALEEIRSSQGVIVGEAFTGLMPNDSPARFAAASGRIPGDLGFDPLGLKPKNEKDLITMRNKELNNGRLAMLATLGILAQEMVTGQKVFGAAASAGIPVNPR